MPKTFETRKHRAKELYAKLTRGPASLQDKGNEKIAEEYKRWTESWILPEVKDLIRELR